MLKEVPAQSGNYESVLEPSTYRILVKKLGFKVKEIEAEVKAGENYLKIFIDKAYSKEESYDPIKEAIERKRQIKPPEDLNQKKPKYLLF